MSSYLNIVYKKKDQEKGDIIFWSSRSFEPYQFFYENNLAQYSDDCKAQKIDSEQLQYAINELLEEIQKDKERLNLLQIRATTVSIKGDEDESPVSEYLSWKEYVDEKIELLHQVQFIQRMIECIGDDGELQAYID